MKDIDDILTGLDSARMAVYDVWVAIEDATKHTAKLADRLEEQQCLELKAVEDRFLAGVEMVEDPDHAAMDEWIAQQKYPFG